MVFEGLDGSFGKVATVEASRCEFKVDFFVEEMVTHEIGDFIVHLVEDWFVTTATEFSDDGLHGVEEAVFFSVGDGDRMN